MSKKEIYQVTFECEVITPMFLGNANPREAELRPPSIKGAMRFWWRAMNAGLPLEELKKKEGELFGTSAGEGKKSAVTIYTGKINNQPIASDLPVHRVIPSTYTDRRTGRLRTDFLDSTKFFAYGKTPSTGQNTEPWAKYYAPGTKFSVSLFSFQKDKLTDSINTFMILEQFGGIGGKSRNGYGSFRIVNKKSNLGNIPNLSDSKLFEYGNTPAFPGFSRHAKNLVSKCDFSSWHDALADMALKYMTAKKKLVLQPKFTESRTFGNKKELVGMLLQRSSVTLPDKPKRISKPFFMKIGLDEKGGYNYSILYLPSKFLEGKRTERNSSKLDILQKEFLEYTQFMFNEISKLVNAEATK